MGHKNKANKACAQMLAITQEKKAEMEKNKHMLLRNRCNRRHRD
jgi:hypothetical protein